jgi:hypothetical protein
VRIIWSEIAQATFVRFMAGQAGMMAVNHAVEALADDPAPPGAFVRGSCHRLRVGPYRVLEPDRARSAVFGKAARHRLVGKVG